MTSRQDNADAGPQPERRRPTDQRRYNRRAPASDVPPPYYETFLRIAEALERIADLLGAQHGADPRGGARQAPVVDLRERDTAANG